MQQPIKVIQGDITTMHVDVIVNAANSSLLGGGGVDGAIHRSGGKRVLEECREIRNKQGGCPTGEAVITGAGNLNAKYLIHTVGPVWSGGNKGERELLARCYRNTLALAGQYAIESIAFPNISTGIYRFPKKDAAEIAIAEVVSYLGGEKAVIRKIIFVCLEIDNYDIYKKIIAQIPPS
ncbi:O-acetyl-ADP-ribose deacetylase [Paenibacillus sp. N3.4]|uniref:O-acetyl-ADP-ribose deacetylase n=1 Tax=Paenibacillus sp. N3.4 TaxID=2603222 RepID=UPI0011C71426|nr:O-acetyl-ADP-ribose deacetylase [Paenibacillus sp. N3.4]